MRVTPCRDAVLRNDLAERRTRLPMGRDRNDDSRRESDCHRPRTTRGWCAMHHANGTRTDTLIEDLELWPPAHPKGQRGEDTVAFALMLLSRYAPHLLADTPRDAPP